MFKKIEVWILYLLLIGFIIFLIFFGGILRHELLGGNYFPRIQKIVLFTSEIPHNLKKYFQITKDPGYYLKIKSNKHKGKKGFIRYLSKKRGELLLLSRYDGNKSRGVVELIDLNNFSILHSWEPNIKKIHDATDISKEEFKDFKENRSKERFIIIHPLLLENGDLLFNGTSPLIKIDFCDKHLF